MQSQLIWNSWDYCNSSHKTPDCGNLPSSWQILAIFLDELDGLLSSFMEDGTPLLVFGDFNIQALFYKLPFTPCFIWSQTPYPPTSKHNSGNQLDLIYTRNCTANNIFLEPLHISDHFFITFKLHFATCVQPTPLPVTLDETYAPFLPPIFPL